MEDADRMAAGFKASLCSRISDGEIGDFVLAMAEACSETEQATAVGTTKSVADPSKGRVGYNG